jgi:hypothetical protein
MEDVKSESYYRHIVRADAGVDLALAFDGRDCGFPTVDSARTHIDALNRLSIA